MTPLIAKPPWTTEEEERLRQLAQSGKSAAEISKLLGRAEKAYPVSTS
jgi:IS30 family transposase